MSIIQFVCVIDDDPIFQYTVKRIMNSIDFAQEVLIYKDGKEALTNLSQLIAENKPVPEVILLDLNMPVMDGWQFLDEFLAIKPPEKITIYIVTSSIDPRDLERVQKYDRVKNYIIKPVSVKDLKSILEKHS